METNPADGNGDPNAIETNAKPIDTNETGMETNSISTTIENNDNKPVEEDKQNEPDDYSTTSDTTNNAQQTSYQLNQEALLSELESNYVSVRDERDSLRIQNQEQTAKISALQSQLSDSQSKLVDQTQELTKSQQETNTINLQKAHIEEQVDMYKEKIDRLMVEADELREEQKVLKQISSTSRQQEEAATTAASSLIPLRYEKERLQTQLESLTAHSDWLETELKTRTEELTKHQKEHSIEVSKLQQSLQALQSDQQMQETKQTQLETDKQQLMQQVEELHSQIKDQKHIQANATILADEELLAEKKVSNLLQEKNSRLEQSNQDLMRQLQSLQELAKSAAKEDQDRQSQLLERVEREMEEKVSTISNLEKQLKQMGQKKQMAEKALQDKHAMEIRRKKLMHEKMAAISNSSRTVEVVENDQDPLSISHSDMHNDNGEEEESNIQKNPSTISPPSLLSLTDLYAQLAETEDELNQSKTENARLQIYLQKICAEMEGSAPKIRQQQKEYRMALQERDKAQDRLEEALMEADRSHRECEDLVEELEGMNREVKELRVENRDLASQVQLLLESRVMGDTEGEEKGQGDLVGFKNVQELQEQNQSLLKEHHKLTEQVSDLQQKLDQSSLQETLAAAEEELTEMREERTRQTTLVEGIVQQRDLYRALLAKADNQLLLEAEQTKTLQLMEAKAKTPTKKDPTPEQVEELTELKAKLFTADNTITSLKERVKRLDDHSSNLTTSMNKLNQELMAANASIARSKAEATYHSEKSVRLEESLKGMQNQVSLTEKRVLQVQNVNSDLEEAMSEANSSASRFELELKQLTAKSHLLETQLKTAQAAETRLLNETKSLQTELSRRGALLDSVQRIEASLSARSAHDMQALEEKLEKSNELTKVTQAQYESKLEEANGKIENFELNIVSLQKDREDAMSSLVKAKDESMRLTEVNEMLTSKSNTLEKQLEEATVKLKALEPETPEEVNTNKQKIAVLTEEVQTVRKELLTAQERTSTYQEIAKKTENDLADLTKVTNQFQQDKLKEIENLKDELGTSKKDADAKHLALVELGQDLANQRKEQKESESVLKVRISTLENDVSNLQKDLDSAKSRLSEVVGEVDLHRENALTAQKNYERELDLHSAARTEVRKVRSDFDVEQRRRETVESQLKTLQFEKEETQKLWEEEKSKLDTTIKEMDERLIKSREQNDLLHSQMNTLTETVEKFQSRKIESSLAEGENEIENKSFDQSKTDEGDQKSEIINLEKSVSELREMIRFMQSERKILDAQLDSLRRTAEREQAISSVAKRSLDEARAELEILQKRDNAQGGGLNDPTAEAQKENQNILQKSKEQAILLKESNSLLREESERLRAKLDISQNELKETKKSLGPFELKIRELEVDLTTAASEKESLTKEVEAWKGRMQNFVSKFQMIDPEEHAKAVALGEKLKKECENIKSLKEKAEQAGTNAKAIVSRLNREVSQQKSLVQEVNNKLAKATAEKDAAVKSSASASALLKKERDELKSKVEKQESELKYLKPELSATKGRVENLTKMLKNYKVKMTDLTKKHQEALANEKEAQKALTKEKENLKSMKEAQPSVSQPTMTKAAKPIGNNDAGKGNTNDTAKSSALTKSTKPTLSTETKAKDMVESTEERKKIASSTTGAKIDEDKSAASQMATSDAKDNATKSTIKIPVGGFKFAPSAKQNPPLSGSTADTKDQVKGSKKEGLPGSEKEATSSTEKATETGTNNAVKKSKIIKLGQSSATVKKISISNASSTSSETKTDSSNIDSLRAKLMDRKRKLVAAVENKKKIELASKPSKIALVSNVTVDSASSQKQAIAGNSSTFAQKAEKGAATADKNTLEKKRKLLASMESKKKTESASNQSSTATDSNTTAASEPPEKKVTLGNSSTFPPKAEIATTVAENKQLEAKKSIFGNTSISTPKVEKTDSSSEKKPVETAKIGFGGIASSMTFGSSSNTLKSFGNPFGSSVSTNTGSSGGTFLNLKPPGSSSISPNLTFGSSSSIKLPMPSKTSLTAPQVSFDVFGKANTPAKTSGFGATSGTASSSTSLFGNESKKRSSDADEKVEQQHHASKLARVEEGKEDDQKDDTGKTKDK